MPYEYYRTKAGPEQEPGIDGGIGAVKDVSIACGMPTTTLIIPVADLDEILTKVKASGGHVIEARMPIPGIGWYATCAEPGGLRSGLIQVDPNAS